MCHRREHGSFTALIGLTAPSWWQVSHPCHRFYNNKNIFLIPLANQRTMKLLLYYAPQVRAAWSPGHLLCTTQQGQHGNLNFERNEWGHHLYPKKFKTETIAAIKWHETHSFNENIMHLVKAFTELQWEMRNKHGIMCGTTRWYWGTWNSYKRANKFFSSSPRWRLEQAVVCFYTLLTCRGLILSSLPTPQLITTVQESNTLVQGEAYWTSVMTLSSKASLFFYP